MTGWESPLFLLYHSYKGASPAIYRTCAHVNLRIRRGWAYGVGTTAARGRVDWANLFTNRSHILMQTRAAILHAVGGPIRVETVELDAPRAGEVLVKVAAAGV